ncbi:MAG: hypothetical protein LBT97_12040 [Planctomycetota bacterium]|jgi:hypothetical protein|nr:hypothetical protein [Planctomycetota bacterium]
MVENERESKIRKPDRRRRIVKWVALFVLAAGCIWLATWFFERSLNSHRRHRRLQSWMDDHLNADVSNLESIRVRLNPLRSSRLTISGLEIEHPNIIFPGKFAVARQINVWIGPLALLGLYAEQFRLRADGLKVVVEQNENGEWSAAGLFNPLTPPDRTFPFPEPKMSGWRLRLEDSLFSLRRRGYDLSLELNLDLDGAGGNRVVLQPAEIPFTLRREGLSGEYKGGISSAGASFKVSGGLGPEFRLIPEHCEFKVENLPLSILPFFVQAMPAEDLPGKFHGMIRVTDEPGTGMTVVCEGEIGEASLAIFGLPRSAPIRIEWPLGDLRDRTASVHLGPPGFGGFDFRLPFDSQGVPKLLLMHGDVASLSDVPAIFNRHLPWLEWMSRVFPMIEWKAETWLGFGWSGDNLSVSLSRSTAGMNLFGEAEMMGGRVRMAMNPGHGNGIATIAAERLDPQLLAVKLSQLLPENWKVALSGAHCNLTWRGYLPGDPRENNWTSTLVVSRPSVDVDNSGPWWRGLHAIMEEIAAMARKRGGDPASLDALRAARILSLEQISAVSANGEDGPSVEFLAHGGVLGEIAGEIERGAEGNWQGRLTMVGPSEIISAAKVDDSEFGRMLDLLSATPDGMVVTFAEDEKGGIGFHYRFLDDAARLAEKLRSGGRSAE